jgi:protein-S-isoprenylcysteine O-methyltransferase Ste14
MITVLGFILQGIELIGTFALWAIESALNALFAAVVLLYSALIALLPGMSDAPAIGHPQWLDWLSWFYPVGDLLAGLAIIVTLWGAFLLVRYGLRFLRAI